MDCSKRRQRSTRASDSLVAEALRQCVSLAGVHDLQVVDSLTHAGVTRAVLAKHRYRGIPRLRTHRGPSHRRGAVRAGDMPDGRRATRRAAQLSGSWLTLPDVHPGKNSKIEVELYAKALFSELKLVLLAGFERPLSITTKGRRWSRFIRLSLERRWMGQRELSQYSELCLVERRTSSIAHFAKSKWNIQRSSRTELRN